MGLKSCQTLRKEEKKMLISALQYFPQPAVISLSVFPPLFSGLICQVVYTGSHIFGTLPVVLHIARASYRTMKLLPLIKLPMHMQSVDS